MLLVRLAYVVYVMIVSLTTVEFCYAVPDIVTHNVRLR